MYTDESYMGDDDGLERFCFCVFFGKQKQLVGNTDTLDESASTNPSGIG